MKRTVHTQKWLDALRSGEYKQVRGRLYDITEGSYCCLGVAAKLANLDLKFTDDSNNYEDIRCIFGIDGEDQNALVAMNDKKEYTFPQIADEIETMLDER